MRLEDLKPFTRKIFRLEELEQVFAESPSTLKVQLSRLCKSKKLIRLKRNCYAIPDFHPSPLLMAQQMVTPSYHSLEWVLSQSSIIPEGTTSYTLVTSQKTQQYHNEFGIFSYRHLPPHLFFGVEQREDGAWVATREKALLDYLYLNSSKFKPNFACFQAERFDELQTLNWSKLRSWAPKYNMKKLRKLVKRLNEYSRSDEYQEHR